MSKSRICLSVIETTLRANLSRIDEYRHMIDLVELRADYLSRGELTHLWRFPKKAGVPVILTLRKKKDGGMFTGEESGRIGLMKHALEGGFSYIDLEEDCTGSGLEEITVAGGGRVIRSLHDFSGVPDDLAQRMKRLARAEKELPKAAVMPLDTDDVLKLFSCYRELDGMEKILVGMGNYGFPTRILAPYLDTYLTFCSVPERLAASGHIDPSTLTSLYRFREVNRDTILYGIIGNPVMHTFSPIIHNRGFKAIGLNALYIPFQTDSIPSFIKLAHLLSIKGFSVTIPHKEGIIGFLAEKDVSVDATGACNTVVREGDGFYGVNTDTIGFLEPLKRAVAGSSLKGKKTTVIGAGGAAKSVVYSLIGEGAEVLIVNRTGERAQKLADAFDCGWASLDTGGIERIKSYSDIIVQTTSVGMEPDPSASPIPDYVFGGNEIVYDIVYNPPETTLLKAARKAGCRIIRGKEMLLGQAFAQFRLFTGREYPDQEGIRKEFQ
ncbi:MAG: shikimate dehydrogenase [Spirochaetales bacterium]|nr:shikimate dehydrogenase [Spirochaetales bacterium]